MLNTGTDRACMPQALSDFLWAPGHRVTEGDGAATAVGYAGRKGLSAGHGASLHIAHRCNTDGAPISSGKGPRQEATIGKRRAAQKA